MSDVLRLACPDTDAVFDGKQLHVALSEHGCLDLLYSCVWREIDAEQQLRIVIRRIRRVRRTPLVDDAGDVLLPFPHERVELTLSAADDVDGVLRAVKEHRDRGESAAGEERRFARDTSDRPLDACPEDARGGFLVGEMCRRFPFARHCIPDVVVDVVAHLKVVICRDVVFCRKMGGDGPDRNVIPFDFNDTVIPVQEDVHAHGGSQWHK